MLFVFLLFVDVDFVRFFLIMFGVICWLCSGSWIWRFVSVSAEEVGEILILMR